MSMLFRFNFIARTAIRKESRLVLSAPAETCLRLHSVPSNRNNCPTQLVFQSIRWNKQMHTICSPQRKLTSPTNLTCNNSFRCFTSDSENKKDAKGTDLTKPDHAENDDPFGLHFEDSKDESSGNIGPREDLPPNYIRDTATGKFTGKIQVEISSKESSLLRLDPLEKERLLSERLRNDLSASTKEEDTIYLGMSPRMANVSRRIREEQITFTTLGRNVSDVVEAATGEENVVQDSDGSIISAPLSAEEYTSLKKFLKASDDPSPIAKKLMEEVDTLIPHIARKGTHNVPPTPGSSAAYDPDMDLEWMTLAAQRAMSGVDESDIDSPFANLMPSDLNPAKKVNRKKAKCIQPQLLHHNNLLLLRRYMTPGGQIMNRTQSRLGAKDQRKVAKLIKRARHLGLIPYIGQWKVEDHGNVKEKDILEEREWERKLIERGLVVRKSKIWKINCEPEEH